MFDHYILGFGMVQILQTRYELAGFVCATMPQHNCQHSQSPTNLMSHISGQSKAILCTFHKVAGHVPTDWTCSWYVNSTAIVLLRHSANLQPWQRWVTPTFVSGCIKPYMPNCYRMSRTAQQALTSPSNVHHLCSSWVPRSNPGCG